MRGNHNVNRARWMTFSKAVRFAGPPSLGRDRGRPHAIIRNGKRHSRPSVSNTQRFVESTMTIYELLRARRREILRIAERHGARNVRIFGSVARREARPDSDVDLLVDVEPGRSLLDLGGFLVDTEKLLDRKVDVVTEPGLRPRIRQRVLDEAIPLLRNDGETVPEETEH